MNTRTLREKLIDLTGYWMYKKKVLPIGADLMVDIKEKIGLEPKTIFDVGANIGQTAKLFSRYFPKAVIHSFEPVSSSFEKLSAFAKKNPGIKPYQLALSNVQEQIPMKLFEGEASVLNSFKNHLQNNSEGARVEMIRADTLDHFIAEHNIDEIDLLKIDTEGYEIPVLNGSLTTLKNNKIKLIYLEVGFSTKNVRHSYFFEVFDLLTQYGFSLFGLYEIHHYDFENENHFGNALFIHKKYLKNNNSY